MHDQIASRLKEHAWQPGARIAYHEIDPALIERAWRETRDFFALPTEEKLRYRGVKGGARGYMVRQPRLTATRVRDGGGETGA